MDFPIHPHLTGTDWMVLFESDLVFPLMAFLGPFQLCFEEGHGTDGGLRQTESPQGFCLTVEVSGD